MPERDVLATVLPVEPKGVPGSSNSRGSRLAALGSTMTVLPAGIVVPSTVVGTRESRKVPLIGLSSRNASSRNGRDQAAVVPELLLQLGSVAEDLQRRC